MKVKLTKRPEGYLDAAPWPKVGAVLDLPPGLANRLIVRGHAKALEEPKARRRR